MEVIVQIKSLEELLDLAEGIIDEDTVNAAKAELDLLINQLLDLEG